MDGAQRSATPSLQYQTSEDKRPVVVKKLEPTPTAKLDRTNDRVYDATTAVVRAVMLLSQGVQQSKTDLYVDLVKKVGLDLRSLLSSVDELMPHFPVSTHREVNFQRFSLINTTSTARSCNSYLLIVCVVAFQVEMAHKVLSKDMAELVNALKLAERYSTTTLDSEYRKYVLHYANFQTVNET